MINLPTLRQLKYLTSVMALKHFGQAAEQCHVTQSTLSAGIQDLENLLGITLLERTNRKVLPTETGLEITQQAQTILSLTTDLLNFAQSKKEPLSGKIRLGIIPTVSPFLLPKVLPTIRRKLPKLEFILIEDKSKFLLDQLETGSIDMAILALPYNVRKLKHKVFLKEHFWVAMPKEHRLEKQKKIDLKLLPIDDLLLLEEGHCLRGHALGACHLPSSEKRTSMQGTSLYTLIEMVAGGSGITLIPEIAVNSDMLNQANICVRPLINTNETDKTKLTRELSLVWRPSYRRQEILSSLNKILSDFFNIEQL